MRASASRNRGMILVVAMVAVVVIAALGAAYLLSARSQATRTQASGESVQLLAIAEAGVAEAIQNLRTGGDGNLDSIPFGGDGGSFSTVTTSSDDLYTITSTATFGTWSRSVEVVVQSASGYLPMPNVHAAVETSQLCVVSGNMTVDGRDYDFTDTNVVGPGVWGLSSSPDAAAPGCDRQGNAKIGGNGVAPTKSLAAADTHYTWPDFDGGFPTDPDTALGLAPGSLKASAQAAGTFFTTQGQVEAYISAHGGNIPGGQIVYCDFAEWKVPSFGNEGANSEPSIVILHNTTGNAKLSNFHGNLRGMLMADMIDHFNAGASVLGQVRTTSREDGNNAFGQGNSYVHYSSAVLGRLPGTSDGSSFSKMSWRELE